MADFSSRGPCEDGRIKPDLAAPGTWIASLQSAAAGDENAWMPISPLYMYQGGTSQAGPQADQTNYISYGPANKDATAKISPEVLKDLPTAPDNIKNAVEINVAFWLENIDRLTERFNKWAAK